MDKDRAAQLIEAGIWLRLSGDHEGARRLFERAAKLDPDNAKVKEMLGGAASPALPEQVPPPPKSDNPFERPSGVALTPEPFPAPAPKTVSSVQPPLPTTDVDLDWGSATGFESPVPARPPASGVVSSPSSPAFTSSSETIPASSPSRAAVVPRRTLPYGAEPAAPEPPVASSNTALQFAPLGLQTTPGSPPWEDTTQKVLAPGAPSSPSASAARVPALELDTLPTLPTGSAVAAPAPSSRSGLTPAPSSRSGPTPAPSSRSGLTPAPSSKSGLTPAPSSRSGLTPAPSSRSGLTPAPTTARGLPASPFISGTGTITINGDVDLTARPSAPEPRPVVLDGGPGVVQPTGPVPTPPMFSDEPEVVQKPLPEAPEPPGVAEPTWKPLVDPTATISRAAASPSGIRGLLAPDPNKPDSPVPEAPDPVNAAWTWSQPRDKPAESAPAQPPPSAPDGSNPPEEWTVTPSSVPRPSPALAPHAQSAWDQRSNPGIKLAAPPEGDTGFDLLTSEHPSAVQAAPVSKNEVQSLLRGARDLLDLDDHTGAMELMVKAQQLAPDDPEVLALRARSEQTLLAMFESKLGALSSSPRVLLKDDEIIWLNLDHRAGFVLAQIDGGVCFEDLFAVSGMSRIDTARILAQLVDEGVISRG